MSRRVSGESDTGQVGKRGRPTAATSYELSSFMLTPAGETRQRAAGMAIAFERVKRNGDRRQEAASRVAHAAHAAACHASPSPIYADIAFFTPSAVVVTVQHNARFVTFTSPCSLPARRRCLRPHHDICANVRYPFFSLPKCKCAMRSALSLPPLLPPRRCLHASHFRPCRGAWYMKGAPASCRVGPCHAPSTHRGACHATMPAEERRAPTSVVYRWAGGVVGACGSGVGVGWWWLQRSHERTVFVHQSPRRRVASMPSYRV